MDDPLVIRSLTGDRAFKRLRKGRSGHAKYLSLRYLPTDTAEVRVGIVVSKRVGKAVIRNTVRRRLREALRTILRSSKCRVCARGRPSYDLLVIARPEAAAASYQELRDALERALKRAALL